MGRGDKRSKRGKRWRGTYGKSRPNPKTEGGANAISESIAVSVPVISSRISGSDREKVKFSLVGPW